MMVLGVDIDDTMAHYLRGLRDFIIKKDSEFFEGMTAEDLNKHFPKLLAYDDFIWSRIKGDREKFIEYHTEAVENGLFRNLEVMEGASETLWRLKEEYDFHIYVITSRFVKNGQHARVLADTGAWLDNANIPYHDIMFARNKVDVIADVYIDDSPKNILSLREAGRPVVIFGRSYNTHLPGPRVENWAEAYKVIPELVIR